MPYHQLFYHLVWATKNREPLLTPDVEPIVYDLLRSKAIGLGATVFAIGGVEDHVHMVVSIPPVLAVPKFIGQVKSVTATRFNKAEHGTFRRAHERLDPLRRETANHRKTHPGNARRDHPGRHNRHPG